LNKEETVPLLICAAADDIMEYVMEYVMEWNVMEWTYYIIITNLYYSILQFD
jgi:hypothetical protein